MNTNDPARPVNHYEELSDMPTNKDAPHTSAGQLRIIELAESNWHDPIIYPAPYDPRVSPFPLGRLFPMPVLVIYPSETRKEVLLVSVIRSESAKFHPDGLAVPTFINISNANLHIVDKT